MLKNIGGENSQMAAVKKRVNGRSRAISKICGLIPSHAADFWEAVRISRREMSRQDLNHSLAVAERVALSGNPQLVIAALTYLHRPTSENWSTKWAGASSIIENWNSLDAHEPGSEAHILALNSAVDSQPHAIVLHLADALTYFREKAKTMPKKDRKKTARKLLRIYAPLASAAGLPKMEAELQEVGFRYADPVNYSSTRNKYLRLRPKAEDLRLKCEDSARQSLEQSGIAATFDAGAPKSFARIWKKVAAEEIPYDLSRFRIILHPQQLPAAEPVEIPVTRFKAFYYRLKAIFQRKPRNVLPSDLQEETMDAAIQVALELKKIGLQHRKTTNYFVTPLLGSPGYKGIHMGFVDSDNVPIEMHVVPHGMPEILSRESPHWRYAHSSSPFFKKLEPVLISLHKKLGSTRAKNKV